MGFSVLKCFEYIFEYIAECDICGTMDVIVMHTGEAPTVDGESIYVHDTQSAIKGSQFQFHRTKNGFICDDCYKKIKGRTESE